MSRVPLSPPSQTLPSRPSKISDDLVSQRVLVQWRDRIVAFIQTYLTGAKGIIITGTLSASLYLVLTLAFPLWTWWYHTNDTLGTIAVRSTWAHYFYFFGTSRFFAITMGILGAMIVFTLFALQVVALYIARQMTNVRQAQWLIVAFSTIFMIILVGMHPITSTDLYGYLARSYLIADIHQNPTVSLATILPGGYLVPHARPPAPYGPLWLLLCGAIGSVVDENLLLAMILMKLLMVVAALGTIGIVAWIAEKVLPGQRTQTLGILAWSPLLLFEGIGNAHNDIVMMFFVVASIALLIARRPILSLPVLMLGILIKYSMGALVPLWCVVILLQYCWQGNDPVHFQRGNLQMMWDQVVAIIRTRINWRSVVRIFGIGGGLTIAVAIICYAPFWAGLKTFTGLGQQLGATYFFISLTQLIFYGATALFPTLPSAGIGSALRAIFYTIFFLYVLYETGQLFRRGPAVTVVHLVQAAGKVVLALLILVTFWYQPWYIVWLVPLAALTPNAALRRNMSMLALGGLMTYPVAHFAFPNTPPPARDALVQLCMMLVAFGFLLIFRHSSGGSWSQFFSQRFSELSHQIERYPRLSNQLMLGSILLIAAMLRLVQLGNITSLRQASNGLATAVSDAHGFAGEFGAVEDTLQHIFGDAAWAVLLPTAIVGTITVGVIYQLASDLFTRIIPGRQYIAGLIAALVAATAQWHIALSRSGVEIVLLPLLITLATLGIWRGFSMPELTDRTRLLWLGGSGICIGLMVALEPGFWLLALLTILTVGAVGLYYRFQRNHLEQQMFIDKRLRELGVLGVSVMITALPTLWLYLSTIMGTPPGSALLARSTSHTPFTTSIFSAQFWNSAWVHQRSLLHLIVTQDYNAAGPSTNSTPLVSGLILPFIIIGIVLAIRWWRTQEFAIVVMLALLPFIVAFATTISPSIIAATTLLPVICLVAALGATEVANLFAMAEEIVFGSENTIFISRQTFLRVTLLLLIIVLTAFAFIWYFATTVSGPSQLIRPA